MRDAIEKLMDDAARRFFPDNLSEIVGYPNEEIKYFGIHSKKAKEHNGLEVVSESLYLVSAVRNLFLYQKGDSLDLKRSKNRWIHEEGVLYDEMAGGEYRKALYGSSPILILRVQNWTQQPPETFKFAELLRYADHERFRKRGLAATVLDKICSEMAFSFGTKFVYVNYGWSAWPKKSRVIPVGFGSKKLYAEISGCFPSDYYGADPLENRRGFFRITDPEANKREHKAAMRRYKIHCQKIDAILAK